jgi:hypothetical protein
MEALYERSHRRRKPSRAESAFQSATVRFRSLSVPALLPAIRSALEPAGVELQHPCDNGEAGVGGVRFGFMRGAALTRTGAFERAPSNVHAHARGIIGAGWRAWRSPDEAERPPYFHRRTIRGSLLQPRRELQRRHPQACGTGSGASVRIR